MNELNPNPRNKHSNVGIAALLIAVIAWSIVIYYFQSHRDIQRDDAVQEAFIINTISVIGTGLILAGISVGLGIGSWFQPCHKRIFGIVGSILGIGMVLAFLLALASTLVVTVASSSEAPTVIIEANE